MEPLVRLVLAFPQVLWVLLELLAEQVPVQALMQALVQVLQV